MYSLISKRTKGIPKIPAICLLISVFPTPVGPAKRKEPIGVVSRPSPALARWIALEIAEIASPWPKTTFFNAGSSLTKRSFSLVVTLASGILAIAETTFSTSFTPTLSVSSDFVSRLSGEALVALS